MALDTDPFAYGYGPRQAGLNQQDQQRQQQKPQMSPGPWGALGSIGGDLGKYMIKALRQYNNSPFAPGTNFGPSATGTVGDWQNPDLQPMQPTGGVPYATGYGSFGVMPRQFDQGQGIDTNALFSPAPSVGVWS
jgi:hypothetical protein